MTGFVIVGSGVGDCADHGWMAAGVDVDRSIGRTKGRKQQPDLSALHAAIAHEIDAVTVRPLHHLGTSVAYLLDTLGPELAGPRINARM